MINEIKDYLKHKGIYMLCFLLFFYVFYMMPSICDRWMESFLSGFEDPWRYIFGQYRWMQIANGRAMSNIFSYFVDKNILTHAIVNAIMVTCILWMICKVNNICNSWIRGLALSCLLLVPWGIQKEVYLYATTLYVSAAFLCIASFYFSNKIISNSYVKKDIIAGGVFAFLASVWLESSALTVLAMLGLTIAYSWYKRKKVHRVIYIYTAIVFGGLLFLFLVAKFATGGRLSNGIKVTASLDRVSYFFNQYYGLFLILSIFVFLYIKKYKSSILKNISMILWLLAGVVFLFLAVNDVYAIISTDPIVADVKDLKLIYGWEKMECESVSVLFEKVGTIIDAILPFLIVFAGISLLLLLEINSELERMIPTIGMGIGGSIIYFMGVEGGNQDRVIFTGIIALVIFIIQMTVPNGRITNCGKNLILILVLLAVISADTLINVVSEANEIEMQREVIVSEVKTMQAIGDWDYNKTVILPSHDAHSRHGLVGAGNLNPSRENIYYQILLEYYGLNENTILEFK